MPCESCAVQFSVFRRKRSCVECERYYCSACLRRGGGSMCGACRVLTTRPLTRHSLAHLKVRDLQYFLQRQNISTRGCVEKDDLVNLLISNVNTAPPRQRSQSRPETDFTQTFSRSIKGFTNNLNVLINSAFDIRPQPTPAPPPRPAHFYNGAHWHATASGATAERPASSHQTNASQHAPTPRPRTNADQNQSDQEPSVSPRVPEVEVTEVTENAEAETYQETADCLEIEDLDDAAEWEFVNTPAEPLPCDSDVLLAESNDPPTGSPLTVRAASELDLRRSESADTNTDTSSLKDEPLYTESSMPKRIRLEELKSLDDLDQLNPKQLKELLTLNRVDFKGCVERTELLDRARRLWRETMRSREDVNKLTIEDSCKICMDAPIECVLLECGHMAACTECSKRLNECPICRQYVVRAVRVFRS